MSEEPSWLKPLYEDGDYCSISFFEYSASIQSPDGWHHQWPYTAEVAMWLIPEHERISALKHELLREQNLLEDTLDEDYSAIHCSNEMEFESVVSKPIKAIMGKPWLIQSNDYKKKYLTKSPAVHWLRLGALKVLLRNFSVDHFEDLAKWMSGREKGKKIPSIDMSSELNDEVPFNGRKGLLHLPIGVNSSAYSKSEIIKQFSDLLDDLEGRGAMSFKSPARGKKVSDVDKGLAALSLLRLRAKDPYTEFWRPLEGTEFQDWRKNASPAKIREQCIRKVDNLKERVKSDYFNFVSY